MKKFIYLFTFTLFFLFTKEMQINAETGICLLTQQNLSYEVTTPFYWYHVTYENLFNDSMMSTEDYYHTYTLIQGKSDCERITGSSPTYERGINKNTLSSRTTNYYYHKELLTNSQQIYSAASNMFNIPSFLSPTSSPITAVYISLDNMPPIIATKDTNVIIVTEVKEKISIYAIQDKITAYDEVDGIIEVKVFEDNYSTNYNTLGTYSLTFSATDKSGNTAKLTINIKVIDSTAPTISGQSTLTSYMSNPLSTEQIKSSLSINDNYDTNLKNLIIKTDNYSSNMDKEGNFTMSFITYDNSNNESLPFTITITVVDDISPLISGNSSYSVNIKNLLDIETILSQLVVTDNIDSAPSTEITSDTYSNNYYKVGIYQITVVAKDKNNNTSIPFVINIVTEDQSEPIFYISQKFIGVNASFEVPIEELITLVKELNGIETTKVIHTSIVENTYSDNFSTPGTYTLKVKYEYENNEELIVESNIVVSNYVEQNKNTPKKTLWSVIKDFILKIWNYIKQIFIFFKELI